MRVCIAEKSDLDNWLKLSKEVSDLFGCDLANDEGFRNALTKNIERGTAFCVKSEENSSEIIGGMLFSNSRKPLFEIGWFAVANDWRRHGVGTTLMSYIITLIEPPAELIVKTFLETEKDGSSARNFYKKMGMYPAEILKSVGPNGEDRQVFRRLF